MTWPALHRSIFRIGSDAVQTIDEVKGERGHGAQGMPPDTPEKLYNLKEEAARRRKVGKNVGLGTK